MTALVMDGVRAGVAIRAQWKQRASALIGRGMTPGLAVILIGENPASQVYVRNKVKACAEMGLHSELHQFTAGVAEQAVLDRIRELNRNPEIHGILVQLPLPPHVDNNKVLEAISIDKDVDGFNLRNLGALVTGAAVFPPCTPYGVITLLDYYAIGLEGQNAVVVGRSNIVGKPMALMLLARNATVTICTSKTRDLAQYTTMADILVVATGKAKMINGSMIKPGAVVVDVGINRMPDGKLAGDVDFDSAMQTASYLTPVPGGVGPMTITMLLANTVQAAERLAEAQGTAGAN